MAGPSSNVLQAVEGYAADIALPRLENDMPVTRTMDAHFKEWREAEKYGTRGGTFTVKKPTRFAPQNTLSFDTSSTGSYTEEEMSVTVDQQVLVNYATTDVQEATYPEDLINTNNGSAINEVANTIEIFNAETIAFGGFRFAGSPNVQTGQMESVGETMNAIELFRSFGGQQNAYYGIPNVPASTIIQSGLQQFVTKRNEDIALSGEIGELNGARNMVFYASNLLPIHTAGTASTDTVNFSTGFTIDSVTPDSSANTTDIVLSGFTGDGGTFVENDLIDIGVNQNVADPIKYLTYTGYQTSASPVQARVTVGGTVSGGTVTITVEPALVFDGTNTDPQRNLSRAISIGTDTVRLATSHRAGMIYFPQYAKFSCPRLPETTPFPSKSVQGKDTNISLRVYYGYVFSGAQTQFVHDSLFGNGIAAEGLMRVLFSI